MINWDRIVQSAIKKLIIEFQSHPFAFVYEADIQSYLWAYINQNIPESEKFKDGFRDYAYHPDSEMTTAMHSLMSLTNPDLNIEGRRFYGRGHLDIGIWDIDHRNFSDGDYRDKPLRLGVEFKITEEPDIIISLLLNFNADVYKLAFLADKYHPVFSGYALWFLPNYKKRLPEKFINIIKENLSKDIKVIAKAITPDKIIDFNRNI